MTAPGVAVMAVLTGSQTIAGRVFDDRNGNGKQDANEPGVAGVPVVINGQVVAATDSGGRFTVPVIPEATLSVVPPAGWQWTGDPLPADAPGNAAIPLHQVETPAVQVAAVTGGVASGLVVAILAGLLFFNGITSLAQAAAFRAIEKTYRRQKSQEIELLMARELAEHRERLQQRLESAPDAWRVTLVQLLADAGFGNVSLSDIQGLAVSPCTHFSVAGSDGRTYIFATSPTQLDLSHNWQERLTRRVRIVSIDTSLSYFARIETQAVWDYLATKKLVERPGLPSDVPWYLVVQAARPDRLAVSRRRFKWPAFLRGS